MGKPLAISRASLVNRTFIARQKDASGLFCALQDQLAVLARHGVLFHELCFLYSQKFGQMFDVALGQLDLGHAAALPARAAIDRVLHLFRGMTKLPLHPVVRLQISAELQILVALFFAQTSNLHQVRNHDSMIAVWAR